MATPASDTSAAVPTFWYDPAAVNRTRLTDYAEQIEITATSVKFGHATTPLYAAPTAAIAEADAKDAVTDLIEAGALRQYKHNDDTPRFVFAYDKEVTDRFIAAMRVSGGDRLLGMLEEQRIALIPEHDGGWHAHVYGDQDVSMSSGYGETPRAAIEDATQQAQNSAKGSEDAN